MKTVIKLLIVALIANGTWRVGSAYLSYYRFKDSMTQLTQHRGDKTDQQITERIFELANEYDVPLTEQTLSLTHDDNHTIVDGSYTRPIDLFPGVTYDWPFKFHIDTFVVEPERLNPSRGR